MTTAMTAATHAFAAPADREIETAHATLMGIMDRMATYTGQVIIWDQVMNSQENLVPGTTMPT